MSDFDFGLVIHIISPLMFIVLLFVLSLLLL